MTRGRAVREVIGVFGLGAVLFLASDGATASTQNENQAPYRAAELVTRWNIVINQYFEDARASVSEEAISLIDQFLSVGAVRAVQDRAGEAQLKKADAGLIRFASAMVKTGSRRPDGSTQVDEGGFDAAKKAACPLYPFCDAAIP